ncbi:hypothetical protein Tco_0538253 [Tanacetum coccineum]
MTNGREMTPPPGFSTLTPISGPNANELPPTTTSAFSARTPENTSLAHRASTSANPDPIISPAFIEANYDVLESLLRELMAYPPLRLKGNYIPCESRFRRFLDNKLEDREQMLNSIQNGPYERPIIPNPDNTQQSILEPISKMTTGNKSQYIADVKVMNYLLQAIPNDIYNSVDACKNAKEMWQRIKILMFGSDVTNHVRHSQLMDEFDKFVAKEGELL